MGDGKPATAGWISRNQENSVTRAQASSRDLEQMVGELERGLLNAVEPSFRATFHLEEFTVQEALETLAAVLNSDHEGLPSIAEI